MIRIEWNKLENRNYQNHAWTILYKKYYSDKTCQIVVDIQGNFIGIDITETFASRRASKSLLDVVVDKAKDAFDDLQDFLDGEDDKEEEQEGKEEVKEE